MAAALLVKKASDGDDATLVIDSGILLSDLVDGNSWLMLRLVGMDSSEPVADKGGERIGGCYGLPQIP